MSYGKALRKGLDILEAVRAAGADGIGYGALRDRIETAPASFARFLKILSERGYVSKGSDGAYRPGWQLAAHSRAALAGYDVRELSCSHLRRLVDETEESAEAAVYEGGHFLFVARAESPRSVVLQARAGSRFPIRGTTALGLLALAFGLAETDDTTRPEDLAGIRRDGFTELLQNSDEVYRGAAALRDGQGALIGCLCVAAPAFRVRQKERALFRRLLTAHAVEVSRALGWTGKPSECGGALRSAALRVPP